MANIREFVCATRALKNAKHIQRVAPDILPESEPPEGFGSLIPLDVLSALHDHDAPSLLKLDPNLRARLGKIDFPAIGSQATGPLFGGTLFFVRIVFTVQSLKNAMIAVSSADYATAVNYAQVASVPISQFSLQYGPNSVEVSTNVLTLNVTLPTASGNKINDANLQGWVNQVALKNNLPGSACVIILNPQGINDTSALRSQGVGGYHSKASRPYIFVNMGGQNITVADPPFAYTGSLSHEIAEMVVDPNVDGRNPEVCDFCGPNCASTYLPYFDNAGNYIATSQAFPPSFPYAFYINGIVTPEWALPCPVTVPAPACTYAPTLQTNLPPAGAATDAVSAAVATRSDGRPFYNWWELGGAGKGWTELTDGLTDSTPAASLIATNANGGKVSPPYLFVMAKGQGQDRNLYLNQLTLGQGQVGWQTSADFETDVAPAMASAGAISVVVANQYGTGRVFYNWWQLGGGGHQWTELPGLLTDTTPAASLIGTNANGGKVSPPYLFVMAKGQGQDRNLYLNQLTRGQGQVGWQTSADFETDVAPAMASAGAISVVVANQYGTGRVFYNWWQLGGGGHQWTELPGLLTDTTPAASLIGTNASGGKVSPPYLFVMAKGQGQDRNLYLNQLALGQGQVGWQEMSPNYGTGR